MLYLIGLGLSDHEDISLKGMKVLKNLDFVYAEFFTSKLFGTSIELIEEVIGRDVVLLNRMEVEEESIFLNKAKKYNVALITGGDPLIATTHTQFLVEAKKQGIKTEVIHGSSILSAAEGISGLQPYKFGKITSIPFPDNNFFPHSPYLTIENNLKNNAHTLVLLDIQVDKDRFMTINQGLEYLLKVRDELLNEGKENFLVTEETLAIGVARVGSKDLKIKAGKISDLINSDFGSPLHCIAIPSELQVVEAEYLIAIAGADESIKLLKTKNF
ncbi:MAG: diphthine synthase [Methanobrevibacter sp.]|jgi:diphthine synthase|nr:diphthine synthase [Candidatus Methanovirga aequatorialis]